MKQNKKLEICMYVVYSAVTLFDTASSLLISCCLAFYKLRIDNSG